MAAQQPHCAAEQGGIVHPAPRGAALLLPWHCSGDGAAPWAVLHPCSSSNVAEGQCSPGLSRDRKPSAYKKLELYGNKSGTLQRERSKATVCFFTILTATPSGAHLFPSVPKKQTFLRGEFPPVMHTLAAKVKQMILN